jgi:cag pathogenicity island protein 24
MTFRRLNKQELAELEKPFIQFLVAHTITGDDWANIKAHEPERASKLIDFFSDFIFEERLKKVNYIQHQEPRELRLFKCGADKIQLIGVRANAASKIDFTLQADWAKMADNTEGVDMYRAEKTYTRGREREIFELLESGCRISEGRLFDVLEAAF